MVTHVGPRSDLGIVFRVANVPEVCNPCAAIRALIPCQAMLSGGVQCPKGDLHYDEGPRAED